MKALLLLPLFLIGILIGGIALASFHQAVTMDDDTLTLLQKSDAQTDQFNRDSKPGGLLNPR